MSSKYPKPKVGDCILVEKRKYQPLAGYDTSKETTYLSQESVVKVGRKYFYTSNFKFQIEDWSEVSDVCCFTDRRDAFPNKEAYETQLKMRKIIQKAKNFFNFGHFQHLDKFTCEELERFESIIDDVKARLGEEP